MQTEKLRKPQFEFKTRTVISTDVGLLRPKNQVKHVNIVMMMAMMVMISMIMMTIIIFSIIITIITLGLRTI